MCIYSNNVGKDLEVESENVKGNKKEEIVTEVKLNSIGIFAINILRVFARPPSQFCDQGISTCTAHAIGRLNAESPTQHRLCEDFVAMSKIK